ncbi:NADP-dependent isocitrate dehydrogenase [Thermorudis peleae]|uniref:NADP-dependent isocitrate dehydrogenase n=1 Tax=Thermorudis peleae TaxID=1382356 RepID=UPI00056EA033|nr:NADP-dependent isocitrate dehydrogenase [Thermorudis peleae]
MKYVVTPQGKKLVTLIPGDGIGPEVVASARRIIEAVGVPIEWDEQRAGASVFREGIASGVPEETVASIRRSRVVLKGPLETPVGYGEKSANVTLRKLFEAFANVRPVRELPSVPTPYRGRGIDLVIVRENVEDLYAGIEYVDTPGVTSAFKVISVKGSEKIIRFAFALARAEGRQVVHGATKANILKVTEGLFKRLFETIAREFPDIRAEHIIIDNCAHQLVKQPEQFDVIVTTNMNGDIISDLASGLVGGLGFAPSANYGHDVAIFEPVHGSAPKYAGKNVINPTAMILTAILMLRYLDEFAAAETIEHALLVTLEEGKALTRDVVGDAEAATTTAFTDAIISNLGRRSTHWQPRAYSPIQIPELHPDPVAVRVKQERVVGVDVFIEADTNPTDLGRALEQLTADSPLALYHVSSRGLQVYPDVGASIDYVDHWRCRFLARASEGEVNDAAILDLLTKIGQHFTWTSVLRLREFDGEQGFSKAQGEE